MLFSFCPRLCLFFFSGIDPNFSEAPTPGAPAWGCSAHLCGRPAAAGVFQTPSRAHMDAGGWAGGVRDSGWDGGLGDAIRSLSGCGHLTHLPDRSWLSKLLQAPFSKRKVEWQRPKGAAREKGKPFRALRSRVARGSGSVPPPHSEHAEHPFLAGPRLLRSGHCGWWQATAEGDPREVCVNFSILELTGAPKLEPGV
jgi:hypothetical protein